MKYRGSPSFSHKQADKIGVLITNLGTPAAPTTKALRQYLKEFLADPRIVEIPRLIWWLILNLVILQIRPRRSAKAYQSIWSEQGSPLMVHTKAQCNGLRERLKTRFGEGIVVEFAMRYGDPQLATTVDAMLQQGVRKLLVLPLYPQYCASTTASTFDALAEDFMKRRWLPELRFVNQYHDHPQYIQALAEKIKRHWQTHGQPQRLIFSYHGIPERYLHNGDPYHCQCHKTSRLVAEQLNLNSSQYLTTFQSRFGREEWLKPYTDHTLTALAKQGIKWIQVTCPGFSADCLETLEEIDEENRNYFLQAGGEKFEYIPALNSDSEHLDALLTIIEENISGWQPTLSNKARAERAAALGDK